MEPFSLATLLMVGDGYSDGSQTQRDLGEGGEERS
jgi:hypothetical protein